MRRTSGCEMSTTYAQAEKEQELHTLAGALLEHETLTGEDIRAVLAGTFSRPPLAPAPADGPAPPPTSPSPSARLGAEPGAEPAAEADEDAAAAAAAAGRGEAGEGEVGDAAPEGRVSEGLAGRVQALVLDLPQRAAGGLAHQGAGRGPMAGAPSGGASSAGVTPAGDG